MAGVGPAQELLAREVGHAGGGHELAAGAGTLDQRGVGPAQQAGGVVGERGGRGERRPHERCPPPRPQPMAHDVADDEHGGLLRPLGHQVEVAADLVGGGRDEGRRELEARTLGKLGGRQRVADRAQVLELVLRRREALGQRGEVLGMHRGLAPQTLDERVVADVARIHVIDVALARVGFGVQPPQLHVLVLGPLGHDMRRVLEETPLRGDRHVLAPTAHRRWQASEYRSDGRATARRRATAPRRLRTRRRRAVG